MISRTASHVEFSAPPMARRGFLAGVGAALVGLGLPARAFAATVPHVFRHGSFEIMVVSDGHLVLPATLLAPDGQRGMLESLLETAGDGPHQVRPAANVTLIRSAADLILVDTGSGADFQPTAGKLMENLEAAGILPQSITKVVFTHAHPDHLWGSLKEGGAPHFPNATHYLAATEWNFWTDADLGGKLPRELGPFIAGAQQQLRGIKDQVKTVQPGEDIVPGVRVLDTAGHTPGHISLEIAGGDGLIVTGDVLPHKTVSFVRPDWRFAFDMVPELAIATRKRLLDRAATDRSRIVAFHLPYPGIGRVERDDAGYRFVPS